MGRTSAPPLDYRRIFNARLAKRMTQAEVAAACTAAGTPINRAQVSMIETGGTKRPAFKIIDALAEVLGIPEDEMYADEIEPVAA